MIKLGITGGIGSGKSTVSEILNAYGIPVYIADIESKKLLDSSPIIKKKLTQLFGDNLYTNYKINKTLLASYIFNNSSILANVNKIIHPIVKSDFEKWIQKKQNYPIVAQESAILFESGFNNYVDKIVTICSPFDLRIERIMKRDNCSRDKVIERINKQLSDDEKVKLSDFVINNDERNSMIKQTLRIINLLQS